MYITLDYRLLSEDMKQRCLAALTTEAQIPVVHRSTEYHRVVELLDELVEYVEMLEEGTGVPLSSAAERRAAIEAYQHAIAGLRKVLRP
jgi:hypothetical protein